MFRGQLEGSDAERVSFVLDGLFEAQLADSVREIFVQSVLLSELTRA